MEPTQVEPGQREINLPVPSGPARPEAYQRAPTLMAGEAAGRQGEVRVWSPDVRVLRRQAWWLGLIVSSVFALDIALAIAFHFNPGGMLCSMTIPIMMLVATIGAVRRPCYLTTDDEGIGVTTSRSTRALRWDEIQSLTVSEGAIDSWRLVLNSGEKLDLNLTGYSQKDRGELQSTILARADLQQHVKKKLLYVRPDSSVLQGAATAVIPSRVGREK